MTTPTPAAAAAQLAKQYPELNALCTVTSPRTDKRSKRGVVVTVFHLVDGYAIGPLKNGDAFTPPVAYLPKVDLDLCPPLPLHEKSWLEAFKTTYHKDCPKCGEKSLDVRRIKGSFFVNHCGTLQNVSQEIRWPNRRLFTVEHISARA